MVATILLPLPKKVSLNQIIFYLLEAIVTSPIFQSFGGGFAVDLHVVGALVPRSISCSFSASSSSTRSLLSVNLTASTQVTTTRTRKRAAREKMAVLILIVRPEIKIICLFIFTMLIIYLLSIRCVYFPSFWSVRNFLCKMIMQGGKFTLLINSYKVLCGTVVP